MSKPPIKLFYSYADKDESLLKEMDKHLSMLKRDGMISEWYNRRISAGQERKDEIDKHLDEADIVLLLVSADFIASDYSYSVEMTKALEKHKVEEG